MWEQVGKPVGFRTDQYYGDGTSLQVLLIFDSAIQSYKSIEAQALRESEKFTVFLARETFLWNSATVMV